MRDIPFCDLKAINRPYAAGLERLTKEIIESGRFIGGPHVDRLEDLLARTASTRFAVGTGNGLDAIKMIFAGLVAIGMLRRGDKVLVPVNTYVASLLGVIEAELEPVPVDVDPESMVIDIRTLEQAYTPEIKALMPVHLYGRTAWDENIRNFAREKNLVVVEDNAQAIGAEASTRGIISDSRRTGALGHAAAFSFYPTKNIGALGDGGAVTTDIPELASAVRALGNYGSLKRYENIYVGYNSRLDPLQAAYLTLKLQDLDEVNSHRRANASALTEGIASPYVATPPTDIADRSMVWHQYVVRVLEGQRENLRTHLEKEGVATDIHYPLSPFLQPCFKGRYDREVAGMEGVRLSAEILSLPVNQSLTDGDIRHIVQSINSFKP